MPDEDPTPDTAPTDSGDGWDFLTIEQIRRINKLTPGTLTLHFARRDVSLEMRGSDAIRILTAHRRRRSDDLGNDVDPETSLMLLDWLTVDLDKALVVSWHAGLDADKVVEKGLIAKRAQPTATDPADPG